MSLIGDIAAPYALIASRQRMIGTIMPDVVVEEAHNDQVVITKHPVEIGAAISDHAFKVPSTVQMKIGFSDSKAQSEGYVQEAYQELLALQIEREPFDVFTGKRAYENMLIESILVTTDVATEHALNAVVFLSEVLITYTDDTSGTKVGQGKGSQANPKDSASTSKGGTRQMTAAEQVAAGTRPI
jgi:hypothetical protein